MDKQALEILIAKCISKNDMSPFYTSPEWRHLREEVYQEQKKDGCYYCKQKGFYSRGEIVHHEKHVRQFPYLALSKTYLDDCGIERRNLTLVCDQCHKDIHNENKYGEKFMPEESWD